PIDVRGLTAAVPTAAGLIAPYPNVRFVPASYTPGGMAFFMPQHSGGGGGTGGGTGGGGGHAGGGGTGGGGTGGHGGTAGPTSGGTGSTGRGGSTSPASMNPYGPNSPWNPNNQPRTIMPQMPDSTATNQNIMFLLASGTGGFVIHETNDLIGGMDRIGKDQNEYYILGYTPPDSDEGSCHTLKVK